MTMLAVPPLSGFLNHHSTIIAIVAMCAIAFVWSVYAERDDDV